MDKTIPIASDHAGFTMKKFLIEKLNENYTVVDFGAFSEESVDYPDMIHPLAKSIEEKKYPLGIILCGSGNGAQMTANKYPHVRAALCWSVEQAQLARRHNNANILSLPARFIENDLAWKMVETFLATDFEGGRHERRVKKIPEILK